MVKGLKDSRGRESKTLTFVSLTWCALFFKFVFSGLTLPLLGAFPYMSGTEFGTSTAAVLAIWLGREWTEKGRHHAKN